MRYLRDDYSQREGGRKEDNIFMCLVLRYLQGYISEIILSHHTVYIRGIYIICTCKCL